MKTLLINEIGTLLELIETKIHDSEIRLDAGELIYDCFFDYSENLKKFMTTHVDYDYYKSEFEEKGCHEELVHVLLVEELELRNLDNLTVELLQEYKDTLIEVYEVSF